MMTDLQTILPISFPFPPQDGSFSTLEPYFAFWDSLSTINWFKQRGYALYKRKDPEYGELLVTYMYPVLECAVSGKMDYPFPHYGPERNGSRRLDGHISGVRVVFAQENDNPSRHVAIKVIATDSEEHRILTFLQLLDLKVLEENCLIPVLNILSNGPYSFVVMPRWGNCVYYPKGGPVQNCFRIMHSLLKALAFLHRHNILHRDIKLENVLVSHFSEDDQFYRESTSRRQFQRADMLQYCLFDFDISMMLPPNTDRARYRLPYRLSWMGSGYRTHDTSQGEFDYDPFAFDVGMLGDVLCAEYQHLSGLVPMLAPFLDRMTTRSISKRFTAAEALKFFEEFLPNIPSAALFERYVGGPNGVYDTYDRWKDLSPDFIREWEDYREPRIPRGTAFLRWLCSFRRMAVIVPAVRWFFYRLTRSWFHARN